jgi:hypothetical protein
MNRFARVTVIVPGLIGLGMVGIAATTVSLDSPVVVAAGLVEVGAEPLAPERAGTGALWKVPIVAAGVDQEGLANGGLESRDLDCGFCQDTMCHPEEGPVFAGHYAGPTELGGASESGGWHEETCWPELCEEKHPPSCHCWCIGSPDYEFCMEGCEGGGGGGHLAMSRNGDTEGYRTLFGDELRQVWDAAVTGSLDLTAVAGRYWNVEVSQERNAVQVLGCGGAVVAHLSLEAPAP